MGYMKARDTITAAVLTAIALGFSFALHTRWCGTPFNLNPQQWQDMVDFHRTTYPYTLRVFMTPSMVALHNLFGLSWKAAFGIIQFSLVAILGMLFYRFLKRLGLIFPWAELGLLSLLLALPIFFAFSEPIHTWDDVWGYVFLTLCADAIFTGRSLWASVWFLIACFAREQTLLYFPLFAGGLWVVRGKTEVRRVLAFVSAPVVIYGLYYLYFYQTPDPDRWRLVTFNFDGFLRTRDTLYSVFMAAGWLWVGWILSLLGRSPTSEDAWKKRCLRWGTIYALPVTVIFALLFTLARETRVMFPPVLVVIPVVMWQLQDSVRRLAGEVRFKWILWTSLLLAPVVLKLGVVLGDYVFPAFEYRACPIFSRLWAGIQIGISLVVILILVLSRLLRRPLPA
jgi:hypothetical protein